MPVAYREAGFRFSFYSNDHMPMHVHARNGDEEAVFNLGLLAQVEDEAGEFVLVVLEAPSLRENKKMKPANRRRALAIVTREQQRLIEAWDEFYEEN